MATLDEINAQIKEHDDRLAALRAQAEELRNAERSKVIEELRAKIAEYGITATDLRLKAGGRGRSANVPAKPQQAAEIKYRSPTGETWSGGRGRKPRWVTEALAAGKSLDEFAV